MMLSVLKYLSFNNFKRIYIKFLASIIGYKAEFLDWSHAFRMKKFSKQMFKWNLTGTTACLRVNIIALIFVLVFSIIAIRLIIIAGNDYISKRDPNAPVNINRTDIVDRNNNLLAVNLPSSSLYANTKKLVDLEDSVNKLLKAIPSLDRNQLLEKLNSKKSFVWIKRDLTPQEHEKIYNLGLPGFGFEKEQKRLYTYGKLLSHVVGYVSRDLEGLGGLEQYFNDFLIKKNTEKDYSYLGKNLKLSIDVRVQNILSEEIDKTINRFNAKGGAGIVVNPNNGEIIAMVSKPDFDPHKPGLATNEQLFNMASSGVYELGSGMKSLTTAMALDSQTTSMNDVYDLSYMKVENFQLKDVTPLSGWHSVGEIFLKSSNIGIAQIMLEMGKENLAKYLRKFGLFEKISVELSDGGRPLFLPIDRWNDLNLTTMSYGYSLSISPLHFVQAMVPIVNGGMLYPLTLVKRGENDEIPGRRVLSEKTSFSMRQLMRLVVKFGTGKKAEVEGYYVGGKTGTAEIIVDGKYDKNRRLASFLGIMPASKPQYLAYVILNQPKGIKETFGYAGGGWVGAPTVGNVFRKIAALYGVEKLSENDIEIQELNNVEYKINNEV